MLQHHGKYMDPYLNCQLKVMQVNVSVESLDSVGLLKITDLQLRHH